MAFMKEMMIVNRLFFVEFEQNEDNISGTECFVSVRLFYEGIQKLS